MRWTCAIGLMIVLARGIATAAPGEIRVVVSGSEDAPVITLDGATTAIGATRPVTFPDGLRVTVTCTSPVNCTRLTDTLTQGGNAQPTVPSMPDATMTSAVFAVPTRATFSLIYKGERKATALFTLNVDGDATPATNTEVSPAARPTGATGLFQLATTQCQRIELSPRPGEVFITPLGTTLTPPPALFSESDTLTVTVVGDTRLLPDLQVRRKSATRVVTGRILGEDQKTPTVITQGEAAPASTPCATRSFTVADFAPGTAEVEVTAILGTDPISLGSFQFLVDPVYLGMFSIGAVWTPLLSPGFSVATRDGQSVIVPSEAGSRRMAYALLFTPFLWDGLERDVRRPMSGKSFYQYVNPSVGFVLNDPVNNVLLGATLDLQSTVLITGGAIFSHIQELDGVKLGDPFSGMTSDLPTHKRWKADWFIGVSVDLRAGVKLLRAVLGTAAGS